MKTNRRDALKLMGTTTAALALGACTNQNTITPSDDEFTQVDVVIIGAGYAGLSAAKKLQAAGKSFIILEARDRVGGRIWTKERSDFWIDQGGQWVNSTQESLVDFFGGTDAFEDKTFPGTPSEGEALIIYKDTRTTAPLARGTQNEILNLPNEVNAIGDDVLAQVQAIKDELNELSQRLADFPAEPYKAEGATELDQRTFQDFILDFTTVDSAAYFLMQIYADMAYAIRPSELSLLHVLHYINAAGGFDSLDNAVEFRVHQGAQSVLNSVYEELKGNVILESPVRKVDSTNNEAIKVYSEKGNYIGSKIILSIPTPMVAQIQFKPALPAKRAQFNQRTPLGSTIKCHLVYDTNFLAAHGLSGIFMSDTSILSFGTNNSVPDSPDKLILGVFINPEESRARMDNSNDEIKEALKVAIKEIFEPSMNDELIPDIENENIFVGNWPAEEFSRGGFASVLPTSNWTQFRMPFRERIGNIHFAGTETSHKWYAYMGGAVQSGSNVAEEVLEDG